jgi:hypothetical protein
MGITLEVQENQLAIALPKGEAPVRNNGCGAYKYGLLRGFVNWIFGDALWVVDQDKKFVGFIELNELALLASRIHCCLTGQLVNGLSARLQELYAEENEPGMCVTRPLYDEIKQELESQYSYKIVTISEIANIFNRYLRLR